MIKNKKQFYNAKTKDAIQILEAGLDAARPNRYFSQIITQGKLHANKKSYIVTKYRKIHLVAVGKAADAMATVVNTKLKVDSGIVVIPQNYASVSFQKNFKIFRAGHPLPNETSVKAAKSIIKLLKATKKGDLVIFLVSGGASALVCLPLGVTLKQKCLLTNLLLKSGASIDEINAVRKHVSQIKGGRILEYLNCAGVSYVLSDVVNDDLSSIASGLTYYDKTTYSDCLKIIKKYHLEKELPSKVLTYFKLGAKGKIPETPKKSKIPNIVVANNDDCLVAMKKTATRLGYDTTILSPVVGDARLAAKKILYEFSFRPKSCLIFGGETTVKVRGKGRGGRNQELVLQILNNLQQDAVVASLGTDGIDGNTNDAGAIFYTIPQKSVMRNYLKNNDSNSFFKRHGGLIKTGPTHTNLLDIGLILKL